MKKFKLAAILIVLFCGTSLYAKDFEWSECWCNYGGGIEQGDWIINASSGLFFNDLKYANHDGFWFIPPVMLEVQYAQPIWKLPFTFGAYAGLRAYGYDYKIKEDGETVKKSTSCWVIFTGAEAAYHIMLPPEGLDLYAVSRLGLFIPVVEPHGGWGFSDWVDAGSAIGANWFFGDLIGVNLELGYPFSKIGVTLKF